MKEVLKEYKEFILRYKENNINLPIHCEEPQNLLYLFRLLGNPSYSLTLNNFHFYLWEPNTYLCAAYENNIINFNDKKIYRMLMQILVRLKKK